MTQQLRYVAKQSAWSAVTFLRVLFSFLIIPLIVMIVDIAIKRNTVIEFYDDYIIQRSGILSKKEKRSSFIGVVGVSLNQTLWQRICHYGDIVVDVPGSWDIVTNDIANPEGLKKYLESKLIKKSETTNIFTN